MVPIRASCVASLTLPPFRARTRPRRRKPSRPPGRAASGRRSGVFLPFEANVLRLYRPLPRRVDQHHVCRRAERQRPDALEPACRGPARAPGRCVSASRRASTPTPCASATARAPSPARRSRTRRCRTRRASLARREARGLWRWRRLSRRAAPRCRPPRPRRPQRRVHLRVRVVRQYARPEASRVALITASWVSARWCGVTSAVTCTPSALARRTSSTPPAVLRWAMCTCAPVCRASAMSRADHVLLRSRRDALSPNRVETQPSCMTPPASCGSSQWSMIGRPKAEAYSSARRMIAASATGCRRR